MKKALQLALGIVTSVGGFFDIGNLVTGVQAGAAFGFQLLWALALGTLLVIFLIEMSGRWAAVTGKTIPESVREHFGFRVWCVPFVILVILHLMTLAAEVGGISFALEMLTGVSYRIWAFPVGVMLWLFLWRTTFDAVEYSMAILGMLTLVFVVAARDYRPEPAALLAGLLPSLPQQDPAQYWLLAVSIVGALISPYMLYFYSSGAIEARWDRSYIWVNRGVSVVGMTFGAVISAGALVVSAMVFGPRHIAVDSMGRAALMLTEIFPFWGYALFAAALSIACTGAALEVSLSLAYMTAQTFGWKWGDNLKPRQEARFATVYTGAILLAALLMTTGLDPLKLTLLSMTFNAAALPAVAVPFLLLMNNRRLLRKDANGRFSNAVVVVVILVSFVLAVVSLPLLVMGN